MRSKYFSTRMSLILPMLIGAVAFLLVAGPHILDPTNTLWLRDGDPAIHYLGWAFFRSTPWTLPIGLNPRYGLELSSSIVYSDSIPLFAFLFKALSAILPDRFQYFGWWILLCFVLQAAFAWLLVGLATKNLPLRLLGVGFFIFSPPMIWRLHGHPALIGHFLILAALYLVLSSEVRNRSIAWGVLLVCAVLVHAYLFILVSALWAVDLCARVARTPSLLPRAALEFVALVAIIALVSWQAGYFSTVGGLSKSGFGIYRLNILSVFDPSGWSYLLTDIPGVLGDYEGFNFLGTGVLLLLIFSLPVIGKLYPDIARVTKRNSFLVALFALLTIYAASNSIGFANHEFTIGLPEEITQYAGVFRASGRMFWPVFYAIVLFSIYVIVKAYGERTAAGLLFLALSLQILDTSAGWFEFRLKFESMSRSKETTPLTHGFWASAAKVYKKVRQVPTEIASPRWIELASYSAEHGLATDAISIARSETETFERLRERSLGEVQSGKLDGETLYVLSEGEFRAAALSADRGTNLLARIDGIPVLAPGWKACKECPIVDGEVTADDVFSDLAAGQTITFQKKSPGTAYLIRGWSEPEDWGTWSLGTKAEIFLPVIPSSVSSLAVKASALVSPDHPSQHIGVRINGEPAGDFVLGTYASDFDVKIPDTVRQEDDASFLRVEFSLKDAARPSDVGLGPDDRILALGIKELRMMP